MTKPQSRKSPAGRRRKSPAGRRRKSPAGRRHKSRGGVQPRAKRRREDDSPSPEKRQKIDDEDFRCGEFCTVEPCFALRNAALDDNEKLFLRFE